MSLEAVEQVQVSVAPYDVRQGNFVGAGVNMVTRSGTNRVVGSVYSRYRNESFVGTEIGRSALQPRDFRPRTMAVSAVRSSGTDCSRSGASRSRPTSVRSTFRANQGGEPVTGSVTRVLASDLNALERVSQDQLQLRDRGVRAVLDKRTPAKPFSVKVDYNAGTVQQDQLPLQPARFEHRRRCRPRRPPAWPSSGNTNWLASASSNYSILENFRPASGNGTRSSATACRTA